MYWQSNLVILLFLSACATAAVSPFQLYSQAIAQANQALKDDRISNSEWLDLSDRLLLEHITGDFRVPAFIKQRRETFTMVEDGRVLREEGARQITDAFGKIKEDTESRFYAQQLDLRYADVMQDIRSKGAFSQSVAGDLGVIGGLAIGFGRR